MPESSEAGHHDRKLRQPSAAELSPALDFQATTPCADAVVEAMAPYWQDAWGNPCCMHVDEGLVNNRSFPLYLQREGYRVGMFGKWLNVCPVGPCS